jgi:hypothetical protein
MLHGLRALQEEERGIVRHIGASRARGVCGGYHNVRPEISQRLIEEGRIDAEEAIVPAAEPKNEMIPWETAKKEPGL